MKRLLIVVFIVFSFNITHVYASALREVPPYIYLDGIDEKDYNIVKTIKEKDVEIDFIEKDTGIKYSWIFDKEKINGSIKLNFDIDLDNSTEPVIENVTTGIEKMYVDFAYHGNLPTNARIKLDVSNKFDNESKLYLYYYNDETKKIEFVNEDIKVNNGYVEFEIDHCSKYILTNAIVNNGEDTPKVLSKVIVGLVFVAIGLMAYTIFKR